MNIEKQTGIFRTAIFLVLVSSVGACATQSIQGGSEFAAYGFLSPSPTSEGELIGVFSTEKECKEAATSWTSRQVVGNPVRAECLPVDKN